jgi:signal transduction histidine kinase
VAKLRLGMLREGAAAGQAPVVDEVRELVSESLRQTKSLTFELSPAVLYELGLGPALERLVEQRSRHGVAMRFVNKAPDVRLPRNTQIFLYQAVRELLANVIKHSRASAAAVTMKMCGTALAVEVEDDGKGFDLDERLTQRLRNENFGLFSLRERLEQTGGKMEIDTAPGRGTRVLITVATKRPMKQTGKKVGA